MSAFESLYYFPKALLKITNSPTKMPKNKLANIYFYEGPAYCTEFRVKYFSIALFTFGFTRCFDNNGANGIKLCMIF